MKPLKFAFIGCGKIAHFHADVVRHLGHRIDVVVARKNSANIDSFAKKYSIREKIYGIGPFLDYCRKFKDRVDCILVCTPWDLTENVLKEVLYLNLPIMTEKPAVLSMAMLKQFKQSYNIRNLFAAYNRRFYDFLPFLKDLIGREHPLCVDILSADPYEMIIKTHGKKISKYILYYYTSHIIDLMFYILGDIQIKNITSILANGKKSWVCELYANKYRCPIQMKILMDCPQNSWLKIFFANKAIEIRPLEKMVIYNKLERKVINEMAVYLPSAKMEMGTAKEFKPGFLNQMEYFIQNFVNRKNSRENDIKQLERVTSFCDTLMKIQDV